jgi:hypothetical protein
MAVVRIPLRGSGRLLDFWRSWWTRWACLKNKMIARLTAWWSTSRGSSPRAVNLSPIRAALAPVPQRLKPGSKQNSYRSAEALRHPNQFGRENALGRPC